MPSKPFQIRLPDEIRTVAEEWLHAQEEERGEKISLGREMIIAFLEKIDRTDLISFLTTGRPQIENPKHPRRKPKSED